MIGVRLEGRLGNQLFQYAFAYSASKKLKEKFYLDSSTSSFLLPRYFEIQKDFLYLLDTTLFNIKGFKNFFTFYLKNYFYGLLKWSFRLEIEKVKNESDPEYIIKTVNRNKYYSGYFQSVTYFRSSEFELRNRLKVRKQYKINPSSYLNPKSKSIIVHIRRTDYKKTELNGLKDQDISLPIDYFSTCLDIITKSINEPYEIYVLSDDITYVRTELKNSTHRINFLSNDLIVDFQLLQSADYLILSNSSFSWWGAFLNEKAKQIFAPKLWCGILTETEFPMGISNELKWIWI